MKNLVKLFLLSACLAIAGCQDDLIDQPRAIASTVQLEVVYVGGEGQGYLIVTRFTDLKTGKYCYIVYRDIGGYTTTVTEWINPDEIRVAK
jgi:hypothetical protein